MIPAQANEAFAQVVIKVLRPGDLIWIHSYPLLLLPAALQALKVPSSCVVSLFLHTPFPSPEVWRVVRRRYAVTHRHTFTHSHTHTHTHTLTPSHSPLHRHALTIAGGLAILCAPPRRHCPPPSLRWGLHHLLIACRPPPPRSLSVAPVRDTACPRPARAQLPHRSQLLRGMLASHVVGFHLFEYARHFMTSCRRLLGLGENVGAGPGGGVLSIDLGARLVTITVSHVGVDRDVLLHRLKQASRGTPLMHACHARNARNVRNARNARNVRRRRRRRA